MGKHIDRTGEVHQTNSSGKVKIIEWFGTKNCTIQFEDGTILKERNYFLILKGAIRNPKDKFLYGVGYMGQGKYNSANSPKAHAKWENMFMRCYYEKYQDKQPTYKDCIIDIKWHNFQNFAAWFEENYIDGFQLDKDILFAGNKIYSPETCCFVPREINMMINGSGKRIGIKKQNEKYYPTISINRKNVQLKSTNTREEAVEVFLIAKKEHMLKVLNTYYNKLDPLVVERLGVIIDNYVKY